MKLTSVKCVGAGTLMTAAESGTIDPVDALRLEAHLASCGDCRAARRRLGALGALMREPPDAALSDAALARAVTAALDARPATAAAPRRTAAWVGTLAAAAAIGALVLAWPQEHRPSPPVLTDGERVIRLPGVRVIAEAGASVRPERGSSAVVLGSGRIRVSVTTGTPFVVRTGRFEAVVAGTRFAVTSDGVEVWEGRVVVRSLQGQEFASLGPSQSWRLDAPTAAPAEPLATVAGPDPATPRASARPAGRVTLQPTLNDVRVALRDRRTSEARAMIDSMRPGNGAEAATLALLRADSLRLDRRFLEAAEAYREVANRWAASPVAETALFSQVQILAERAPAQARRTLDEYRRRYPRGRFLREADELSRRLP